MVKAKLQQQDGRTLILLGLSAENIERLKADEAVTFNGAPLGIDSDVAIVYGETELAIAERYGLLDAGEAH